MAKRTLSEAAIEVSIEAVEAQLESVLNAEPSRLDDDGSSRRDKLAPLFRTLDGLSSLRSHDAPAGNGSPKTERAPRTRKRKGLPQNTATEIEA